MDRTPGPKYRSDTRRMTGWVRIELAKLETILDPVQLAQELRERELFPSVDQLHDPLGEPLDEPRWW